MNRADRSARTYAEAGSATSPCHRGWYPPKSSSRTRRITHSASSVSRPATRVTVTAVFCSSTSTAPPRPLVRRDDSGIRFNKVNSRSSSVVSGHPADPRLCWPWGRDTEAPAEPHEPVPVGHRGAFQAVLVPIEFGPCGREHGRRHARPAGRVGRGGAGPGGAPGGRGQGDGLRRLDDRGLRPARPAVRRRGGSASGPPSPHRCTCASTRPGSTVVPARSGHRHPVRQVARRGLDVDDPVTVDHDDNAVAQHLSSVEACIRSVCTHRNPPSVDFFRSTSRLW